MIYLDDAIDAIEMLLEQSEDDEHDKTWNDAIRGAINAVKHHVPSEQPEIIRCKDCKWWDKSEDSPFGYCMAMKHGYMSTNWEIGIYRRYKGDFYCADAERRTDE